MLGSSCFKLKNFNNSIITNLLIKYFDKLKLQYELFTNPMTLNISEQLPDFKKSLLICKQTIF